MDGLIRAIIAFLVGREFGRSRELKTGFDNIVNQINEAIQKGATIIKDKSQLQPTQQKRVDGIVNMIDQKSVINYEFEAIVKSQTLRVNANSISFKNTGDVDITIEGFLLEVGSGMLSLDGDKNELNRDNYKIIFAGGGTNPRLDIIRKLTN